MNKEFHDQLSQRISSLSKEVIIELAERDDCPQIYSVVTNLFKEAFSVLYNDVNDYHLVYIRKQNELKGYCIDLGLNVKYRSDSLSAFCVFLHEEFSELDEIVTFNTFQKALSILLEKDGYFTMPLKEYLEIKQRNGVIMAKGKGLVPIRFIDKMEMYNTIFKGRTYEDVPNKEKVYLMFNANTAKIKIGHSRTMVYRERTLQSKEPNINLICGWIAPKEVEKELHKEFKEKRVRGEWFNLNPRDLIAINDKMKKYKKVQIDKTP